MFLQVCMAAGEIVEHTDWLEGEGKTPSWPQGMQNIISAKCLKAVENIPITEQLECSLTTQTIMASLPADAALQTLRCDCGGCSTCGVAAIFSHLILLESGVSMESVSPQENI